MATYRQACLRCGHVFDGGYGAKCPICMDDDTEIGGIVHEPEPKPEEKKEEEKE